MTKLQNKSFVYLDKVKNYFLLIIILFFTQTNQQKSPLIFQLLLF